MDRLTPAQREILALAARGLSNREIAEARSCAADTVRTTLCDAYRRAGVEAANPRVVACLMYLLEARDDGE
jgi:DNA-binding CsgD family transcriptional regulator